MDKNLNREIFLSGASDSDGVFRIYEKNEWRDFLRQNANHRITLHATASPMQKKAAYLAYYWAVLIPRVRQGFNRVGQKKTLTETEETMRKRCFLYEETPNAAGTGYNRRLKSVRELNDYELFDYIDTVKMIVAEYLNIYIDDPINY